MDRIAREFGPSSSGSLYSSSSVVFHPRCVSKNAFSWFLTDILEVHSLEEIKNARGRYGRRSQGYWRTVNAGYKKCRDSSSDRVSTEVEQLKKKQKKGHRRENVLLHGMMTRL